MEAAKVSKDLQIEFDRLALKAAAGMVTKKILICHETNWTELMNISMKPTFNGYNKYPRF